MFGAFKLNTLSAAMAAGSSYVSATGGNISWTAISGTTYKIHSFTAVGNTNFVVSAGGTVDALIVGGGGGSGGALNQGTTQTIGGGGGGRVQTLTAATITPQTYTVTVGDGGTGGTSSGTAGGTGGTSSALGTSSVGGGPSPGGNTTSTPAGGLAGGGGGSGTLTARAAGTGTFGGGSATAARGNAGGGGSNTAAGQSGAAGRQGGAGVSSSITGTAVAYAKGGNGGTTTTSSAIAGNPNTGDGSTGGSTTSSSITGASGGTGIVIVRYPVAVSPTVTVAASAASSTSTIVIPATAAVGDVALLFDTSTTVTNTVPSGFSDAGNSISTTGIRTNISYKQLVSGDPGATITGMAGTTKKILLILRVNNAGMGGVNFGFLNAQATTTAPTTQTLTVTNRPAPLLQLGVYSSTGTVLTRGFSTGSPTEYSSGTNLYVKLQSYQLGDTPAASNISMSDGGTNILQSFDMMYTLA